VGALNERSPYAQLTPADREAFADALPPAVRSNRRLVGWLAQRVENYRNRHAVDEDGELLRPPDEKAPRARDLAALRGALRRLERALDEVPRRLVVNGLTSVGVTESRFRAALDGLESEISKHAHRKARRSSGPGRDRDRRSLQNGIAQDLHRAGFRLTTAPGGVLARTLEAAYEAAGIRGRKGPVHGDNLFPTLRRLAHFWSPASIEGRARVLGSK